MMKLAALAQDGRALKYVHADETSVRVALAQTWRAIDFVPASLQTPEVLRAVAMQ